MKHEANRETIDKIVPSLLVIPLNIHEFPPAVETRTDPTELLLFPPT